ncbi:MAG: efflux RND transporter permease subunit [Polyangiaceae bacterium]|nr:efflux RND transporter permease subunit [Polyangiaceae bacterium]
MLTWLVRWSTSRPWLVLSLQAVLIAVGGALMVTLPIDALPDVSTIQVSVLTRAPGLSAVEVERSVTFPIEAALNGSPRSVELRSVSRGGLSAVTLVFRDGTDVWFARQVALERLRGVELPEGAGVPELAPVSSGLGEILQFVVRSDQHTPMQLRTLLDWTIAPKLREVAGVVEVNAMGGDLKQLQVVASHEKLRANDVTLGTLADALRDANLSVGGGYIERGDEAFTVRGQGLLASRGEVEHVVVRADTSGGAVLVKHVAEVEVGSALRQGVVTRDGKGEAVTGVVMMLLGENSRDVVNRVGARFEEIRGTLPPGVKIDVLYDRKDLVGRTLATVGRNLAEGVLVVTIVLAVFLGTLRGALAVVIGVPVSMTFALAVMHLAGVTGDLMSLGAIDFGFLVDGPVVMLEAVGAACAGRAMRPKEKSAAYGEAMASVGRPVAFAIAIIVLVYVPLLTLEGVEGKMFRPMAITMAAALFGALVYAVAFFPGVLVALMPPPKAHTGGLLSRLEHAYAARLPWLVSRSAALVVGSVALLIAASVAFARQGAEFVPRIFEGDAVVTVRRAPSIGLTRARELDLEVERVLAELPEVKSSLGMTGRAEVAVDPVGNDNTDIFVHLAHPSTWTTARDFDALSEVIKTRVEGRVVGTFVSVSQPIEDRTNELISGSRADVSINLFADDLNELVKVSSRVGAVVRRVPGTGDVRVERLLGQPEITATANRARMARHGVRVRDAFDVLVASREGLHVGSIYEGERRFDMRLLGPPVEATPDALGNLFVETTTGRPVPLSEVVDLKEGDGVGVVRRQMRKRTARVDVNLRGRDLVSWVAEAQREVDKELGPGSPIGVEWGGQFENFERARRRLSLIVPAVLVVIGGMLFMMFGRVRPAVAVFAIVPFSLTGGLLGMVIRGYPFSLPAAVGFIALGGVAVLNGLVVTSEVLGRLSRGEPLERAVVDGCAHVLRPVLTTAAVAALGFAPMALSQGAGAEVQRPLATVVVFGIVFGTATALLVLPGVLARLLRPAPAADADETDPQEEPT